MILYTHLSYNGEEQNNFIGGFVMRKRSLVKKRGVQAALMVSALSATLLMGGCSGKEAAPVNAQVTSTPSADVKVTEESTEPESTEPESTVSADQTAPVIEGTKDIEVAEGKEIDFMVGVSATDDRDGDITASIRVSDYDSSLLDEAQPVTYSVADSSGNVMEVGISLLIKSNPLEAMEKEMYATSDVNVRGTSSKDGEKIGSLGYGEKVQVVSRDKNTGWYQIEYKDGLGFVSDDYLSDTKPAPKPAPSSNKGSSGQSSQGSQNSGGGGTQSKPSQAPTPAPAPTPKPAPSGGGNSNKNGGGKTGLPTDDSANEIDRGKAASDAAVNALEKYY